MRSALFPGCALLSFVMHELKPLLDLLTGKLPWLPTLIVWIGALKVAFYLCGNFITRWAASKISDIVESSDVEDDHFLERFLSSRFYITLRFFLLLFSLPLPSRADYEAAYLRKTGQAPKGNGLALLLLLVPALFFTAGCAKLAPTGIYKSDQVLYSAELILPTTHELMGAFLKWEMNNAAVLKRWPEIHVAAEKMRRDAPTWFQTCNNLHDAYKLDPSQENKDKLQTALRVLSTALTEANAYMLARTVPPDSPKK